MSKFNLKLLLAIIVGVIKVVVDVLSGNYPDELDNENNIGGA